MFENTSTGQNIVAISATTLLSITGDHSHLDEWRAAIGPERAAIESNLASSRGTLLHNELEKLVKGDAIDEDSHPFNIKYMYKGLQREIEKNLGVVYGCEVQMLARIKGVWIAGTSDVIGEYDIDNRIHLCIIDYKTSKRRKHLSEIEDYRQQLLLYTYMLKQTYGYTATSGVILIAQDDGTVQKFIVDFTSQSTINSLHDLFNRITSYAQKENHT